MDRNGESNPTQSVEPRSGRGFEILRIAGIDVAIDASWLIVFLLVSWSLSAGYFPGRYPGYAWSSYLLVGVLATLAFFASVLLHEFAHAVAGNRLGQEVRRITLFIFGGMAHLSGEPRDPATELKIAAVGPATSLALGGVFWAIAAIAAWAGAAPLAIGVLVYLAFINVALAVFNLLPGFPLDGGRLLRAWLWKRSGDLRAATARASDWGVGIAFALTVLGALELFSGALVGGLWLIFIAMFLRGAARAGYYGVVVEQILSATPVREIMVSDPVSIDSDLFVADAIEQYFLRYGYGGFPVASNGEIVGLLSLAQVRTCPAERRSQVRVREIMRLADDRLRLAPSAPASEALRRMTELDSGRLLVTENGDLAGLITRTGLNRFVQLKSEFEQESSPAAAPSSTEQ